MNSHNMNQLEEFIELISEPDYTNMREEELIEAWKLNKELQKKLSKMQFKIIRQMGKLNSYREVI